MKEKWRKSFFGKLFAKKPMAGAGLIILILLVLVAIFADVLAPVPKVGGRMQTDVIHKLQKPWFMLSAAEKEVLPHYILGTDSLGRDVLSYLIYGARTSVILCVGCTLLSMLISVAIGTLSAVIGGWFDLVVQRFVDAWQCIPNMLMLMILMSIFGNGMWQLIFAMAVPSGISGSRMIRSAAIGVKDSGYMKVSGQLGCGTIWKTIRHVIPNIMPLVIVSATGALSSAVMMESSMNFLGMGVEPGTPSWGYMITNQGRPNMYLAPWLALLPSIMIALMVFSANMFGDGVRDMLDPRLKGGVGSYNTKRIQKMAAKQLKKFNIKHQTNTGEETQA